MLNTYIGLMLTLATLVLTGSSLSGCASDGSACNNSIDGPLGRALSIDSSPVDVNARALTEGNVRGLLTDTNSLQLIRARGEEGDTNIASGIRSIVDEADKPWPFGDVGTTFSLLVTGDGTFDRHCVMQDEICTEDVLTNSGHRIYARVLAYQLTGEERYAVEARALLLSFSRSSGFAQVDGVDTYTGANQCALNIAMLTPLVVESALLLENYSGWSSADKIALQQWLRTEVYPLTSAIARTRKNNWGNASAFASWAIAHYLIDSGFTLDEVAPTAASLTPLAAREAQLQNQIRIVGNSWPGDSQCDSFGVQLSGGIPDELRRGSSGCAATSLAEQDLSWAYQVFASSFLTFHAKAVQRLGDNELFQLRLDNGRPLVLRTVLFVIDNQTGESHDWSPTYMGVLRILNTVYQEESPVCEQLTSSRLFTEGRYLPFTRLLYPDVCEDFAT